MENNKINIAFVKKELQDSEYDWANISLGDNRIGKVRCAIINDTLIIYSINIYDQFSGHGYGKEFIEEAKKHFNIIIADRVRFKAIGFWEKMDFLPDNSGNWVFHKK